MMADNILAKAVFNPYRGHLATCGHRTPDNRALALIFPDVRNRKRCLGSREEDGLLDSPGDVTNYRAGKRRKTDNCQVISQRLHLSEFSKRSRPITRLSTGNIVRKDYTNLTRCRKWVPKGRMPNTGLHCQSTMAAGKLMVKMAKGGDTAVASSAQGIPAAGGAGKIQKRKRGAGGDPGGDDPGGDDPEKAGKRRRPPRDKVSRLQPTDRHCRNMCIRCDERSLAGCTRRELSWDVNKIAIILECDHCSDHRATIGYEALGPTDPIHYCQVVNGRVTKQAWPKHSNNVPAPDFTADICEGCASKGIPCDVDKYLDFACSQCTLSSGCKLGERVMQKRPDKRRGIEPWYRASCDSCREQKLVCSAAASLNLWGNPCDQCVMRGTGCFVHGSLPEHRKVAFKPPKSWRYEIRGVGEQPSFTGDTQAKGLRPECRACKSIAASHTQPHCKRSITAPEAACLRCLAWGIDCVVDDVVLPFHDLSQVGFGEYTPFSMCKACCRNDRPCDRQRACDSCVRHGDICDNWPIHGKLNRTPPTNRADGSVEGEEEDDDDDDDDDDAAVGAGGNTVGGTAQGNARTIAWADRNLIRRGFGTAPLNPPAPLPKDQSTLIYAHSPATYYLALGYGAQGVDDVKDGSSLEHWIGPLLPVGFDKEDFASQDHTQCLFKPVSNANRESRNKFLPDGAPPCLTKSGPLDNLGPSQYPEGALAQAIQESWAESAGTEVMVPNEKEKFVEACETYKKTTGKLLRSTKTRAMAKAKRKMKEPILLPEWASASTTRAWEAHERLLDSRTVEPDFSLFAPFRGQLTGRFEGTKITSSIRAGPEAVEQRHHEEFAREHGAGLLRHCGQKKNGAKCVNVAVVFCGSDREMVPLALCEECAKESQKIVNQPDKLLMSLSQLLDFRLYLCTRCTLRVTSELGDPALRALLRDDMGIETVWGLSPEAADTVNALEFIHREDLSKLTAITDLNVRSGCNCAVKLWEEPMCLSHRYVYSVRAKKQAEYIRKDVRAIFDNQDKCPMCIHDRPVLDIRNSHDIHAEIRQEETGADFVHDGANWTHTAWVCLVCNDLIIHVSYKGDVAIGDFNLRRALELEEGFGGPAGGGDAGAGAEQGGDNQALGQAGDSLFDETFADWERSNNASGIPDDADHSSAKRPREDVDDDSDDVDAEGEDDDAENLPPNKKRQRLTNTRAAETSRQRRPTEQDSALAGVELLRHYVNERNGNDRNANPSGSHGVVGSGQAARVNQDDIPIDPAMRNEDEDSMNKYFDLDGEQEVNSPNSLNGLGRKSKRMRRGR